MADETSAESGPWDAYKGRPSIFQRVRSLLSEPTYAERAAAEMPYQQRVWGGAPSWWDQVKDAPIPSGDMRQASDIESVLHSPVGGFLGPMAIRGYHGSPHNFAPEPGAPHGRFRNDKIGTGEGAAAFGEGHYIAEQEGIARGYRDKLTQKFTPEDDVARHWLSEGNGDVGKAVAAYEKFARESGFKDAEMAPMVAAIQRARGKMYEVEIKAEPEQMLHWDLSFDQQPPKVQEALKKLGVEHGQDGGMFEGHSIQLAPKSGAEIYQELSRKLGGERMIGTGDKQWGPVRYTDPAAASRALHEAGIPGIRYLDGGSRPSGEGTYNYVVFDPSTIDIIRKYGLGALIGAGAAGVIAPAEAAQQQDDGLPPVDLPSLGPARGSVVIDPVEAVAPPKGVTTADAGGGPWDAYKGRPAPPAPPQDGPWTAYGGGRVSTPDAAPAPPAGVGDGPWTQFEKPRPGAGRPTIASDLAERVTVTPEGLLQPFRDLPGDLADAERKYRGMVTEGASRLFGSGGAGEPLPFPEQGPKAPPGVGGRAAGALEATLGVLGYPFAGVEGALKSFVGRPQEPLTGIGADTVAEVGNAATQLLTGSPTARKALGTLVRGEQPASEGADAVRAILAPASRGPMARQTAGAARQYMAEAALTEQRAAEALRRWSLEVGELTPAQRLQFIDDIEMGRPVAAGPLTDAARTMRELLDARMAEMAKLGVAPEYVENYFPHLWKNPDGATGFARNYVVSHRSLEGGKGFTKERFYPTVREGMEAGLVPITDNPVELVLAQIAQMDKFISGQKLFAELKANGFVRPTAEPGWVPVNDKIAGPTGRFYAPEPVARIINNMLSPGLGDNTIYQGLRGAANFMNQAQLGLSAFHMGFEIFDSMTSRTATALRQLSQGHLARGSRNFLTAPAAPIEAGLKGDKLLKQYLGTGSYGPEMEAMVDHLVKGGGRVTMDKLYRSSAAGSFWQAVRQAAKGGTTPAEKVLRGAQGLGQEVGETVRQASGSTDPLMRTVSTTASLLARTLDTTAAPLMEYFVPRMKLGVFFDMMRAELQAKPAMTLAEQREVAQKVWNSVDNRMGQLVYDNLFWDRTLKDASMLGIRSVGWNLGTLREAGVGVKDLADAMRGLARGDDWKGLSQPTAYMLAMTMNTAIAGAIYQYLKTGEGPQELKDYFYPKTGGFDERGAEERVSLPSYMHDYENWVKHPKQTAINKINPLPSAFWQMSENKDFFGASIWSHDEDRTLARDTIDFIGQQFTPFGFRTDRLGEESKLPWYERQLGVRLAPSDARNPERAAKWQYFEQKRADKKARQQRERQGPGASKLWGLFD